MNNSEQNIMSNEPMAKVFWRFAIPSVTAMVVNGLYQIVDGMFVGHYIGYQGLAGINLAWPLIGIIAGMGMMIGMGGGSLISISRGESHYEKSRLAVSTSLWLSVFLGVLISIILYRFGVCVLQLQGAENEVLRLGSEYVSVFSWGAIFTVASAALPMLIRNDNSPNTATAIMAIGALINIALDYLFIGILGLELKGAAIATLLSQLFVIIIALGYFFSKYAQTRLSLNACYFDRNLAIRSITLGSSSLLMFFYFSFISAIHNKLLLHYGTPIHVGAFAVIVYIGVIYYLTAEGIANGMQPLASYFYGSKQGDKVISVLTIAIKSVVTLGVAVVIVLYMFPNFIVGFFSQGDPNLLEAAVHGMKIHLLGLALDGFIFVASVYFVSVDQGGKALGISACNMIIQLPFLYLLPNWFGIDGVWLSVPLSNLVLSLIIAPVLWNDIRSKQKFTNKLIIH